MDPLILNALVAIIVVLFFLIQGISSYRAINGADMYFLYGRNLQNKEYSRSFAAASTSLATVLFFFVILGISHGLYILYAPLTYLLGCFLYSKLFLPALERQGFFNKNTFDENPSMGTTLGSYIELRYRSKVIKYSIMFVTFLGMMSILLIELFVGVTIFSIYLKEQYVDLALLFIAFVVFAYTGLGGLFAVVKTDRLQFGLMIFSVTIFLAWLVWESVATDRFPSLNYFIMKPISINEGILIPYPLLFNILVVNLLLVPSLLRTWQLAAASSSSEEVRRGVMNGAWLTGALTGMFVFIGIFFFRCVFPNAEVSLQGIFNALHTSNSFYAAYIIFPMFFAACLAAMLSTADSSLIPLLQSLFQDFRKINTGNSWKHGHVLICTAFLLVIAIGLYFIVFRLLKFNLISWLFTIFSFLIICTPSIIFAVLAPDEIVCKKSSRIAAFVSIWGGLLIAIVISVVGNRLNLIELVQLNSPFGALFASLCFLLLLLTCKYSEWKEPRI
ncbi:MAG: hypothetical protein OEY64_12115 [Nitrospinota bacterium]|nr:hypothetical protein [Nitrospinota bacterium]